MQDANRTPRRRHSADLKQLVLTECNVLGASVAQVALAHGLNANLVHKWRRSTQRAAVVATPIGQHDAFIALSMAPPVATSPPAPDIRIELRRGAMAVNVAWPLSAASHCAAWLRELLR